jgi:hypothetical protein
MKIQIKITMALIAVFTTTFLLGYCAGRLLGNRFVEDIVLKQGRLPLLLSRPVNQFYDIYTLINSNNPFSRLSGYYSLVDNKMINEQFLMERFPREQNEALSGSILWILSYSDDTDAVVTFYASVYNNSSDQIKKRILSLMRRVNKDYYMKFIIKNKIDARLITDEGREINNDLLF